MNINDLDLDAAIKRLGMLPIDRSYKNTAKDVLQAAIPEICDWNGTDELRINHRVRLFDGTIVRLIHHSEISGWTVEYNDGSTDTGAKTHLLKPIPQVKKIAHSSLAHTMIDCTYTDSDNCSFYAEYNKHNERFKSIRMNHWMVWVGSLDSLKAVIPEGYEWGCSPTGLLKNVIFKVTAVKEGYTL